MLARVVVASLNHKVSTWCGVLVFSFILSVSQISAYGSQDPTLVVPYEITRELSIEKELRSKSRQIELYELGSITPEYADKLTIDRYLSKKTLSLLPGNQDGLFVIEDEKSVVKTTVPLHLGKVGELFVQTAGSKQEIVFNPDEIIEFALERKLLSTITRSAEWGGKYEAALVLGADGLVYELSGEKTGRLLGFYEMSSKVTVQVSPETGVVMRNQLQNEWFQRLALLIL